MKRRTFLGLAAAAPIFLAGTSRGWAQGLEHEEMLTVRERERMHERLRDAATEEEQARVREEYREMIRARMPNAGPARRREHDPGTGMMSGPGGRR